MRNSPLGTGSRYSRKRKKGLSRGAGSFLSKLAIVVSIIVVIAGGAVGFMFVGDMLNGDRDRGATPVVAAERSVILENIYINGIYVGGLTFEQALERLSEGHKPDVSGRQLIITATQANSDTRLVIGFDELDPGYDFTDGVIQALNYGTNEDDAALRARLRETPAQITYSPVYSYDDNLLALRVEEFMRTLEREAKNATSERRDGAFHITEEVVGLAADIPATLALARELVASDTGGTVDAVFNEIQPSVTAEALRGAQTLLGTFTTRVSGALTLPRNINVINAARNMNDTVVAPGEVFSTNYHFGAMTYANGYRYAPIILQGQFVDGIGGGVCQVSSTLYMALLFAEMEIVERRNHSLRVGYIGWAMDATLAGDWIDLRFRNNTDHPVYVESFVTEEGEVVVNIFGYESRPAGRTLSFEPVHVESIPHGEDIIEDDELEYGKRVVETSGVTGQRYALYKTVFQDGVQVDRYRVNTSTYRAVNAVVRVGTGGALEGVEEEATSEPGAEGPSTSETIVNIYTGEEMVVTPNVPSEPDTSPSDDTETELPDLSNWLSLPIPGDDPDDE